MAYFDKYGVEFSDDRKKLVKCPKDFQGEYIVPDSVEEIGIEAFKDCTGLTSIDIPNSVFRIESYAFRGCTGLITVSIPKHDKWMGIIGREAFYACTNLRSVLLPSGMYHIGEYAFHECTGLTSPIYNDILFVRMPSSYFGAYTIPSGIEVVCRSAFSGCTGLTSVTIPNSVWLIDDEAFYECTSLTSVVIPPSVTKVGNIAFSGCSALKKIIIYSSVTEIGYGVFGRCTSLTEPIYNAYYFICLPVSYSGTYSIPNGIQRINGFAFADCVGLTSITIPNSVEYIGYGAFSGCTGLTSITIPNSVTIIDTDAFSNCSRLASINLSNSVSEIWGSIFEGCDSLSEICVPLGREDFFCQMEGLEDYADIIRQISEEGQQRETREQELLQAQQLQELLQGSTLFFDTETTGKPLNYKAPVTDSYNWPRLVQLAWIMTDKEGNILKKKSVIIKPKGFSIPTDAVAVHGITTERAERDGLPLSEVLEEFATDLSFAERIVGHNIDFDQHIVGAELWRLGMDFNALMNKPSTCTMKSSTDFCAIPNPNTYYGGYKWPSLQELYQKLFDRSFDDAHDALADISATKECFFELKRKEII